MILISGQSPCPPSRAGRRRVTPAMIKALEELKVPPTAFPSKLELLRLLRGLRGQSLLSRGALELLICLIEKTSAESWGATKTPFIYAHNATISRWTGYSLSTLHRYYREILEAGLMAAQERGNAQRGRRWQGQADEQIGFNLASLRHRWAALQERVSDARRQHAKVAFLRHEITVLNEEVRLYAERVNDDEAHRQASALMRRRMRSARPETLEAYHTEMAALLDRLKSPETLADRPVENIRSDDAGTLNLTPQPPQSDTHYTDTKNIQTSKKVVPVAGSARNRIEEMRREVQSSPIRRERTAAGRSPLHGFKATGVFYLEICPPLRALCQRATPTDDELVIAAETLSERVGITYHAWVQAARTLGHLPAAVAAIIMAARQHHGHQIRHPDAYFRALVERGIRDELHLDRSLYALRDHHNRHRLAHTR